MDDLLNSLVSDLKQDVYGQAAANTTSAGGIGTSAAAAGLGPDLFDSDLEDDAFGQQEDEDKSRVIWDPTPHKYSQKIDTTTHSSGNGKSKVSTRRIGDSEDDDDSAVGDDSIAAAGRSPTHPVIENVRYMQLEKLRRLLTRTLNEHDIEEPKQLFERWIFSEYIPDRLTGIERDTKPGSVQYADSLIPSYPITGLGLSAGLRDAQQAAEEAKSKERKNKGKRKIKSKGRSTNDDDDDDDVSSEEGSGHGGKGQITPTVINAVIAAMDEGVRKAHQTVAHVKQDYEATLQTPKQYRPSQSKNNRVRIEETDTLSVTLKYRKVAIPLNRDHLCKLRVLYRRARSSPLAPVSDTSLSFQDSLAAMLFRYQAIQGQYTQGSGMHAALHEGCFDVLRKYFEVELECFASPLNCHWDRFCSAFGDVDAPFGSLGSFFDWYPTQGSYEANPHFVPEVISALTSHLSTLLKESQQPLSFAIIVPRWTHTIGWQSLAKSRWCRSELKLGQKHHGYTEGAQHMRATRYRVSTCDTSVFWWQNDAGKNKWPVTDQAKQALADAFANKQTSERDSLGVGNKLVAGRREMKQKKNKLGREAAGEHSDHDTHSDRGHPLSRDTSLAAVASGRATANAKRRRKEGRDEGGNDGQGRKRYDKKKEGLLKKGKKKKRKKGLDKA